MTEELLDIAEKVKALSARFEKSDVMQSLRKIEAAANDVGRSSSGSWLGYHSRVYYRAFHLPRQGEFFNSVWGIRDDYARHHHSNGNWVEYDKEDVVSAILKKAGGYTLSDIDSQIKPFREEYGRCVANIESILNAEKSSKDDEYLSKLLKELHGQAVRTPSDIAAVLAPKSKIATHDLTALNEGIQVPPHIVVLAEVSSHKATMQYCDSVCDIAMKAAPHIGRVNNQRKKQNRSGTNVFIGHGQSKLWRELKDFVAERLRLPWDEFNRVPVAGIPNTVRLSEMLDSACVAFLVLTAEDETGDGKVQARMNVIHEVGLFQGRLGFTKAIVLLEEGCEEFSNIQGLGSCAFLEEISRRYLRTFVVF